MSKLKAPSSPLVSVDWLNQNLYHPGLVVLDASLKQTKNATSSLVQETLQIPGARFFDIENTFSDKDSLLPHMLPEPEAFTREAQKLGISKNSYIVVYDNRGIYSSPRAWWMFKAMGHGQVYVLDGGLPEWVANGFVTEPAGTVGAVTKGDFVAKYNPALVSNKEDVLQALQNDKHSLIIDARSAARFQGKAPEPRPGLRLGHMPNASNLPFETLLNNGRMKPKAELEQIFQEYPLNGSKMIFSCGSGVTACITALGATLAGYDNFSVYDGSWSEWGASEDSPIVTD
mgnify:CR=1 FL=1